MYVSILVKDSFEYAQYKRANGFSYSWEGYAELDLMSCCSHSTNTFPENSKTASLCLFFQIQSDALTQGVKISTPYIGFVFSEQ